jgi:hypothetical protein
LGEIINIYGTDIELPQVPPFSEIEDWGESNIKEQYWRRKRMPDMFKKLVYDKEGNIELTQQQQDFCLEELRRIEEGFWFFSNGIPTYISGRNYYYLQYWTLENKKAPEYRDVSRRYFLFVWHWRKIWWCRGVMRGKSRRSGATSESSSNLSCEATTVKNSKCGIISKTSADARKVFIFRVQFGYRHLVFFLQPSLSNDKDSKSELVFNVPISKTKKVVKAKLIDDVEGLNSMIDYQPTALNSYDSERLSYILIDEGGKFPPDVPFSQFLSVISETLVEGSERVGFAEIPSTVNEMTKKGGAEFKLAWDDANQFLIKKKAPKKDRTQDEDSEDYFDVDEDYDDNDECTANMFVRYYVPAYDGLAGFIDKYGMSIIDNPTQEQIEYVFYKTGRRIRYGAKRYLENRRAKLKDAALEEEKRKYSFDEDEMFMQAGVGCEFNAENITSQIKIEEENPTFWRQARLIIKKTEILSQTLPIKKKQKKEVGYMDDTKAGWFILETPNKLNLFTERGGYLEPLNKHLYQVGVDTTQDRIAIQGSNPAITVFKKSCIINGEETGMYPVALWISPTRLDVHFDEEVLKACMWYGCTANYEIDRRTDFYRYFCKENSQAFLEWTPRVLMNPLKPTKKQEYGSRSGDPFQLAQMLQISKWYVDGDSNEVYNGHIHRVKSIPMLKQILKYDHLDRTKSDLFVSLQMALVACFGEIQAPIIPQRPIKILQTYKIEKYAY